MLYTVIAYRVVENGAYGERYCETTRVAGLSREKAAQLAAILFSVPDVRRVELEPVASLDV